MTTNYTPIVLEPKVYTATEVASLCRVSVSHVSKTVTRQGHWLGVPAIRGVGRRLLFSRVAIDAALAQYDERVA